jgi:glycosyltransferase involved in cell wall biosynthesis
MGLALIIPLYEPSGSVLPFLRLFGADDFASVVVVDDGSGPSYQALFAEISALPNSHLISYPRNRGKGHALKEGLRYVSEERPDIEGAVTADGDGQHSYADIIKVRDELRGHPSSLVLGVRDLRKGKAPSRNRFGNAFSASWFWLSTGVRLKDTQTGLRGLPRSLFPLALETKGERYDYEMAFLMAAVKEAPLRQVPIEVIYGPGAPSHFRPIRDSLIIYKTPLLYVAVALLSEAIDLGLFTLFHSFFAVTVSLAEVYAILCATVGARLLSGAFNFALNNAVVFRNKGGFAGKLLRYGLLFFANMILRFALTYAFSYLPSPLAFIKFVVDFFLFLANYLLSRSFVFARKKKAAKDGGRAR